MTVIITVHGTSAGDQSDEGSHWWQRNSDFQKRLASWLDLASADVRIEPFHWDKGPNSELARRGAGHKLFTRLEQLEGLRESYLLIAHSHGGSVIWHALIEAAGKRYALPHLKQWITIGTPFISMRRNRFTLQRLSHAGKIVYILTITSLIGIVTLLPVYYQYGKNIFPAGFQQAEGFSKLQSQIPALWDVSVVTMMLMFLLSPIISYFILHFVQRRIRRRYSETTNRFMADHFISRWLSLRSRDDEAINALHSVKPLKLSLFDRKVLIEPVKTLVIFGIVVFYAIFTVWQIVIMAKYGITPDYVKQVYTQNPFAWNLSHYYNIDFDNMAPNPVNFGTVWQAIAAHPLLTLGFAGSMVVMMPVWMVIMWFLIWLALSMLHLISYLLGIPASWFLNTVTSGRLRRNAFGNDTIGEYVEAVGPMPEICDYDCGAVPDEVELALRSHVEKYAALAFARARKVLGVNSQLTERGDIAQVLADQLTGSELIHTAYFDVDAFAKLIAVSIDKAGVANLSADFRRTEDCEALFASFDQIRGPSVGAGSHTRAHVMG